ncbi:hypothetical protein G6F65_014492 [Rhizopus arrhizus]|nr:hypothetical protein G6F65_014492 [Rhizopus arrhizus]
MPVGLANLVAHRAQAEPVGLLAEAPDQCAGDLRRSDRIAHRDQRTAIALHHHEALLCIIAQHRLVGGQHQAGLGIGGTGQYRRQRLQRGFIGGRQRAAGAVQQSRQAEHHQRDGHHQQRTQRTRRVAGHRELPPQLVLVFDMAVGEEQQPGNRDQHQAEVAQPRPRPGLVQQRTLAVELAARGPQGHRRQHCGNCDQPLAAAQPQRQRGDHAHRHRQHPRRMAAPGQALADQQQRDTAEAADQVRGFQDRQRGIDQMPAWRGQCAVDDQRGTDAEHRQRDDLWQPGAQCVPAGAGGASAGLQRLPQGRGQCEQGGQHQRQHVVGNAVDQRGGQHRRRCNLRQQLQQAPFEHAEACGDGGDQAGQHRDQVQADEAGQAGGRRVRQQHVERGAGQYQFDHAEHGDADHGAAVGQPQAMAEHAELAAFAADQQQHRQIGEQRDDADHAHRVRIQRQCQRRGFRLHAQRHADQQPGTEHEAERAHQHHLADLRQVQAGSAVTAQAHRATGQRGEAHGLAQRMCQECGDADACRMHADAAAAQADGVKADQAGVAGQAKHHGKRDLRAAELMEGVADGAVAVLIELGGQPMQAQCEDQQRDDDGGRGGGGRD